MTMAGSYLVQSALALWFIFSTSALAWVMPNCDTYRYSSRLSKTRIGGSAVHGENSCFLPLKQLVQDDYSPRIIQIAGAYPGLTKEDFTAVSSEPSPDPGQWTYDFSDPDGPQLGTVALQGSEILHRVEDPVVVIAEHQTLGVELPKIIKDPVDLIVLVDRAKTEFDERKFFVVNLPSDGLTIRAYESRSEMPEMAEILGKVEIVQIPWLPGMAPTKTGFAEADEYFTA